VGLGPGEGTLALELAAPEGHELSPGAPWTVALEVSRRSDLLALTPEFLRGESEGGPRQIIRIHASAAHHAEVDTEIIVTLRSVACDARDHAACFPVQNSFRLPLRLLARGQPEVRVVLPLELPR
jgi:hypothetical protein